MFSLSSSSPTIRNIVLIILLMSLSLNSTTVSTVGQCQLTDFSIIFSWDFGCMVIFYRMSGIMNFLLLYAGYFCIPIVLVFNLVPR